jgi:CCR4-NOT transcription complex subunit 7/8
MLKIIQLGITLADENGELAKVDGSVSTWQFNFRFNLDEDMYAQDSIDLLTKSGIDFLKHTTHGIDVFKFGELLITSGLVMLDEVKWISFHSGYDFGYLVKIMSCISLPKEEADFRVKLKTFFPSLYDIKFLMKSCRNLKGGLQDIAEEMGIQRIGPQHQAGSDSLLTGMIFFQMRQRYFDGKIDDAVYLYAHHSTVHETLLTGEQWSSLGSERKRSAAPDERDGGKQRRQQRRQRSKSSKNADD